MMQWEDQDKREKPYILECGVCGKRAVVTDEVMDTWHPEVWAEYDDGTPTEEVSPVCDEHEVTFNEETGVGIIRLAKRPERQGTAGLITAARSQGYGPHHRQGGAGLVSQWECSLMEATP